MTNLDNKPVVLAEGPEVIETTPVTQDLIDGFKKGIYIHLVDMPKNGIHYEYDKTGELVSTVRKETN